MVWQGKEKVGNIFSFEFPYKIAGEMRLGFYGCCPSTACKGKEQEKDMKQTEEEEDICRRTLKDAEETTGMDPGYKYHFGLAMCEPFLPRPTHYLSSRH